jgi:hypothetical protein
MDDRTQIAAMILAAIVQSGKVSNKWEADCEYAVKLADELMATLARLSPET